MMHPLLIIWEGWTFSAHSVGAYDAIYLISSTYHGMYVVFCVQGWTLVSISVISAYFNFFSLSSLHFKQRVPQTATASQKWNPLATDSYRNKPPSIMQGMNSTTGWSDKNKTYVQRVSTPCSLYRISALICSSSRLRRPTRFLARLMSALRRSGSYLVLPRLELEFTENHQ